MYNNGIFPNVVIITFLIAMIGAINWGLVGLINFNLVEFLVGNYPVVIKTIYITVGFCGLYSIYPIIKMINLKNSLFKG